MRLFDILFKSKKAQDFLDLELNQNYCNREVSSVEIKGSNAQNDFIIQKNAEINIKSESKKNALKDTIKGGFGEPYCCEQCYKLGGRLIYTVMLNKQSGKCGFCQKPVHTSLHGQPESAIIPYEGKNLFICLNCVDKAKAHLAKYNKCCYCGRNLYTTINDRQPTIDVECNKKEEMLSNQLSSTSGSFHEIGILFDINKLGGGFYGYSAFKIFFDVIDPHKIAISTIYHGDILLKNRETDVYCIAVQSFEMARIVYIRDTMLKRNDNGLLSVEQRFIEGNFILNLPLVTAGRIDLNGKFIVPKDGMISINWGVGTVWNIFV
jgi:hypothetical protein